MAKVIVAGSFDPITIGHLDIIERAASIFEEVTVAVVDNREKTYMFTPEQRLHYVEASCRHIPNVKVAAFSGMMIDFCRELNIFTICKGIRNAEDLAYEQLQTEWNHEHEPRIQTIYLPASKAFEGISSTLVRNCLKEGGCIRQYVPEQILDFLYKDCGN